MPLSWISQRTRSPTSPIRMAISPDRGVYLIAFEMRFRTTWRRSCGSAITVGASSTPVTEIRWSCVRTRPATSSSTLAVSAPRSVGCGRISSRPRSSREMSSRSLTRLISRSEASRASATYERMSIGISASATSSSIHLIPDSGVRSWCVTKETKSVFIWLTSRSRVTSWNVIVSPTALPPPSVVGQGRQERDLAQREVVGRASVDDEHAIGLFTADDRRRQRRLQPERCRRLRRVGCVVLQRPGELACPERLSFLEHASGQPLPRLHHDVRNALDRHSGRPVGDEAVAAVVVAPDRRGIAAQELLRAPRDEIEHAVQLEARREVGGDPRQIGGLAFTLTRFGVQPRLLEAHARLVGEGRQERHVIGCEASGRTPPNAENAHGPATDLQGHAEVGVVADPQRRLPLLGVLDRLLLDVLDDQRLAGGHDPTAQALAHTQRGPRHELGGRFRAP